MSDDYRDSMMEIFVFETNQFLEEIENILIQNEEDKTGLKNSIPEIFRIMHTIKSSSAMMELTDLSKMTHAMEDVFFYLRENTPANVDYSALTDMILDCVDCIKSCLQGAPLENMQAKTDHIHQFLLLLKSTPADEAPIAPPSVAETPAAPLVAEAPVAIPSAPTSDYKITVFFKSGCQMVHLRAFEIQNRLQQVAQSLKVYPENDAKDAENIIFEKGFSIELSTAEKLNDILDIIRKSPFLADIIVDEQQVDERQSVAEPQPSSDAMKSEAPAVSSVASAYINVAAEKLDSLVDLISEMIIAEMDLSVGFDAADREKERAAIAKLKKLIAETQDAVLLTRMVPIRDTFQKMRRIVRDINKKQNKISHLKISGEETEVDRNIIDTLNGPLMHIVRNAVDHGIESSAEREKLGKPAIGNIELSACTQGRNVIITVTDDGRGFDKEKILQRAIEKKLIEPSEANSLTDNDIYLFVFNPGFSTNDRITEFSGRGVGMDVVNSSIAHLHGSVYIESTPGMGSTITLKLPLTMAVIESFIVDIDGNVAAIPITDISEIVRVKSDSEVHSINGRDSIFLRNECYQIVNLADFFQSAKQKRYSDGIMLVAKNSTSNFVVFADAVFGKRSIVVKPVPTLFEAIRGISGCTILADGKTSLILSVNEIFDLQYKRNGGRHEQRDK